MAAVLCLDFDDTLVLDNTMRQVMEKFAPPEWRELEADYHAGNLSVEQYNAAALDLVEAPREAIEAYVASVARPRPGAVELLDWATWHGWQPIVVSNGYDLYIDPVLANMGFDRVIRHAGRAASGYRWRVRYFSPRGIEVQERFKVAYASAFQQAGDFVAYVGDGASDVGAARLAQAVFLRDTLWERLSADHPRIYPFETLHDVVAVLDKEAEAWLASFSSTTAAEA